MSETNNIAVCCFPDGTAGNGRSGPDLVAEVGDVEAIVSGAMLAEDITCRRVTFSEENMVHHIPVYPASNGDDVSWQSDEEAAAAAGDGSRQHCGCWSAFQLRVKVLKRDILALYYAVHHPDTPWYCKLLPWLVLAYALSPLDLIPDFIPVLGLLDDMLLLPLGLWISYRLIPKQVMLECRDRAQHEPLLLHRSWPIAVIIFTLWTAGLLFVVHLLVAQYGNDVLQQYEWAALVGSGGVAVLVFLVWLISRVRYEARRREEWNVSLLSAEAVQPG